MRVKRVSLNTHFFAKWSFFKHNKKKIKFPQKLINFAFPNLIVTADRRRLMRANENWANA